MQMTRRKFLVAAASVGAVGSTGALMANGDTAPRFDWRGSALGGEARVSLYVADPDAAHEALAAVAREIERLETIFSLYRPESQLSRLNATGQLDTPSRDLEDVLRAAIEWRNITGGAFDPTIQTVWRAVADGSEISPELLATIGAKVSIKDGAIALADGSALTLNGIAQGRIADRVTKLLVSRGFTDVIVDAGELRLPGKQPRAVGIPAAKAAVSVAGVAIATSEPKTLVFDQRTWRHHLIDPRTGQSPQHWQSISVFARDAQTADALSTAFAVLPFDAVADLSATIGDNAVIGRDRKGRIRSFGDPTLTGGTRVS